jgi:hypothetical protein
MTTLQRVDRPRVLAWTGSAALADGLRHLKVEADRRATHLADTRRS